MKGIGICHPRICYFWPMDYFELKTIENQLMHEEDLAEFPYLTKSRNF